MTVEIPDKSYFKIGEVSRIVGVEPYNIRYWESQFRSIRPSKTKSNQRLYRRREIELLLRIKDLLYNEGYTIAGAKKRLKEILSEEKDGVSGTEGAGDLGLSVEERKAYDAKLADAQGEIGELRAQVEQLATDLDEVQTTAPVVDDTRITSLTDKLERAELERARLAEALDRAEAERDELRRRIDEGASAAESGGAELEAQREELDRTRAELERVTGERDEAVRERYDAERQRDQAVGERDEASRARDEAAREWEQAVAERDEARRERDAAQQGREEARQERAEAVQLRVRLERQIASLETSLATAAEERDAARAETESLRAKLSASELDSGRVRALENERATLAGRLEAIQVEMTRLKRALDAAQISFEQSEAKRIALSAAIRAELAPLLRIGE